jgi:preprotein translocase subunit SecG
MCGAFTHHPDTPGLMFAFLLVVHAIIAATLVTVILMQKSEGGGLGMGGSPSGLMSARGAADFLTRATAVLATVFVVFSIVLAFVAATKSGPAALDTSLARTPPPAAQTAPAPVQPAPDNGSVPLAR